MASIIKVDDVQDAAGNNIINESGDTITIGASGDTITVPSGATFNVAGTVGTGFTPGITEADMWRLNACLYASADPISANLERVDNATFAKIGTGMSVSTGVWTFPSTGLWWVSTKCKGETLGSQLDLSISATANDGSAWDSVAMGGGYGTDNDAVYIGCDYFFNVTDTSNYKIKFVVAMATNSNLAGYTTRTDSAFIFIRLGASQ